MPIIVVVTTKVKPEFADGFAKSVTKAAEVTSSYEGMLDLKLYRDDDDPTRFVFIEKWESRARHEAYLAWRESTGTVKQLEHIIQQPVSFTYCGALS